MPQRNVVAVGEFDVGFHDISFRSFFDLLLSLVFPTYLKKYFCQPLMVSIILFFDAKIRIIIKTAHSVVQFFAVFAR